MNKRIEIKRISIADPLYQEERKLRNRILLRPIGIPDYGWEKNDPDSWHFVAVTEQKVVGCAVLVPLDEKVQRAQLIQMAIEKDFQGQGLGSRLVSQIIQFAKELNISEIIIHSRSDVTAFYAGLGFEVFGKEFEEVGIRHRYMKMPLDAPS